MIRFRSVILLALGLQLAAVGSQEVTLTRATMLASYPALIFVALANLRLLGMRLILLGAVLNFTVMAANGGLMPVSPTTVADVESSQSIESSTSGRAIPGSKSILLSEEEMTLGALADRFVIHLPILGSKVTSVGDLLIGAGLAVAIIQVLINAVSSAHLGIRHG